jgi:hypothetical protein
MRDLMQRKIMMTMMMVKIQTSSEKASRQVANRNMPRAVINNMVIITIEKSGHQVANRNRPRAVVKNMVRITCLFYKMRLLYITYPKRRPA